MMKAVMASVVALIGCQIAVVNAAPLSVGVGAGVGMSPYKQYDTPYLPFPVIHYDDGNFYIRGLGAGIYGYNDGVNKFSVDLNYSPFEFKPGDTDNSQMQRLNRRRDTMMAGASYTFDSDWGRFGAKLAGDTLDHSNGWIGDLNYHYKFDLDGGMTFTPGFGMEWASANQNRYYFGISSAESARSGLRSYQPGSTWQPYVDLMLNYAVTSSWNVYVQGRYTQLNSTITNSPMVNKSYIGHIAVGTSYTF